MQMSRKSWQDEEPFVEQFKMNERGAALSWFLWISGMIIVNQPRNNADWLERFVLADWKPVSKQADISAQLSKKDCLEVGSAEAMSMKATYYRGIMSSLLYIAKQTKPDFPKHESAATVTQLSRFLENPRRLQWVAEKRFLLCTKMLTGLEICMIESQLLAKALLCRSQGQQLIGAPRSNQLQAFLPVRLRTKPWQQLFKSLFLGDHFLMRWAWLMADQQTWRRPTRAASRNGITLWCRSERNTSMWNFILLRNQWCKMRQSNSSIVLLRSWKLTCGGQKLIKKVQND